MRYHRRCRRRRRLLRAAVFLAAVLLTGEALMLHRQSAAVPPERTVTVHYHDQTYTIEAMGDTAEALLRRLGLTTDSLDRLSPSLDTVMQAGMTLTVDRMEARQEVYTLSVPPETLYTRDLSLPVGMEKLLTPGRSGELRCTAVVRYVNGIEAGRTCLSQELVSPSQVRVIAVGANEDDPDAPVIGVGCIQIGDALMTYTGTAILTASAYTHTDLFRSMTTALGTTVHAGTIAVDPAKIPLGTRMFLTTEDGSWIYGIARAEDTLAGTEGTDMELYFPTVGECMDFGVRRCRVYFLG